MMAVTYFTLVFRLARRNAGGDNVGDGAGDRLARPHLFTLFFVVIFLNAVYQVKEGRTQSHPWAGAASSC